MGLALSVHLTEMSILQRFPSYRESNKRGGGNSRCLFNRVVCLTESQIKGVKKARGQL